MTTLLQRIALLLLFVSSFAAVAQKRHAQPAAGESPAQPIKLVVDATHAPEKMLHAQLQIPVTAGEVKLVFPKWIPGEHGPTGPITDVTGLQFSANGQRLNWRRDLDEMYMFHVTVPQGVTTLEARLDLVMPAPPEGFSSGASATTQLDLMSWNQVVLYVPGKPSDDIQVVASLKLPAGWHYGTALPVANEEGGQINFQPASLTTLIDSPVISGAHFRRIALTPDGPIQHYIDEVADGESALQMPAETIAAHKRLMAETGALFGARHYRDYHFLLTLSDHTAHFGLEHHESSDDRVGERTMVDDDERWLAGNLLSHEMTHSWNGKYRRPKGLATPDYQAPMEGDLLWVYEGLTEYLGNILAPRAGLWTKQQFLDETAEIAAALDHTPGRSWRPLQDTADAAQLLYSAAPEFESWRRSVDYYPEGFLIWLEVDTVIRQQTRGEKSINNFCQIFHGGGNTPSKVLPYIFDDVVKTLNDVTPYDWKKFLRDRLDTYGPGAPLGGITNSGWRVVYTDTASEFTNAMEKARNVVDARFSIGLALDDKGGIHDVIVDSPAWKAGIAPGTTLVAVNGRKYNPDIFHDAMKESKSSGHMELLVMNGDYYKTFTLDYHDGEKFAHLVRDGSKPDILSDIIKPLAK
ncbi:MAG TPA: M61 family peptidase [Candidatus Angelobacter sp.]|jgi:predicted metalloprotease with PDZ domain|nr:M61 family peptidase [Candidatus Angelobacter sp.]